MATKKELLEQARALGLKPVTRSSVPELEAMIAGAKPKATRKPKAVTGDENPAVVRLIEAQQDGGLRAAIDAAGLKVGTLARQLDATPGVIDKLVKGTRVPRASAAPESNPGKLGAWLVAAEAQTVTFLASPAERAQIEES